MHIGYRSRDPFRSYWRFLTIYWRFEYIIQSFKGCANEKKVFSIAKITKCTIVNSIKCKFV